MSKRNKEEDQKIILSCLEIIMKSKSGKALVEFALQHDVQFGFDDHQKSLGYFTPQHNAVVVRGDLGINQMVGVIIHEMRHAHQHHNGFGITTEYSPEDMVFMSAVMEADAEAAHSQIAKELAEAGVSEVMNEHLKSSYGSIQKAYNAELAKSGNVNAAKLSAFNSWFKVKNIRNGYAHDILSFAFLSSLELASQAKRGFVQLKDKVIRRIGSTVSGKNSYLKSVKIVSDKYRHGGLHRRIKMMVRVFMAGLKNIIAPKNMRPKIACPSLRLDP